MKGSTLLRLGEQGWGLGATRLLDVEERKAREPDAAQQAADGQPPARRRASSRRKGENGGTSLH
ncbi:hypothetical protein DIR46_00780 [Massilia oculi]|uniref:Uncharacterized protein n=1 Tax=Massilia oculi TaxID=945844 RepID=A0A2S2DCM8_9BURK|nr:hypothetical protein DIR46_00780 [Massilia oculi]